MQSPANPQAEAGNPPRYLPGARPAVVRTLRIVFALLGAISTRLAARLAMAMFITPTPRPLSTADKAFVASARAGSITVNGESVTYYDWPAAGPRVLIVHGWVSHAARMADVISGLRGRGLAVIALDAPAHGLSGGRQCDVPRYQAAIDAVLTATGSVDAVLAHSFGSLTALHWLAGAATGVHPAAASVRAAVLVGLASGPAYMLESFCIVMRLNPAIVSEIDRQFTVRYGRTPAQYDSAPVARTVAIPVLLVHGELDELIPVSQPRALAGEFARCELDVYPGMVHSEPLRQRASVERMADFLADRLQAKRVESY